MILVEFLLLIGVILLIFNVAIMYKIFKFIDENFNKLEMKSETKTRKIQREHNFIGKTNFRKYFKWKNGCIFKI